jgi:hypothetical protein
MVRFIAVTVMMLVASRRMRDSIRAAGTGGQWISDDYANETA